MCRPGGGTYNWGSIGGAEVSQAHAFCEERRHLAFTTAVQLKHRDTHSKFFTLLLRCPIINLHLVSFYDLGQLQTRREKVLIYVSEIYISTLSRRHHYILTKENISNNNLEKE